MPRELSNTDSPVFNRFDRSKIGGADRGATGGRGGVSCAPDLAAEILLAVESEFPLGEGDEDGGIFFKPMLSDERDFGGGGGGF